ncbi:MinD/ParA family ATP-binding protein [Mycolicibacter longobardus]|uniref:ATPase n=1 Tax=Mycolicibacter longobardus TaxID=1108812 RepID=A0A1X1Y7Y8_9MYCO|nr:MinD/ParA family protein [Mycolicibacter longobardus]MCV7384994.1 MinD/ParA family protein [Mycolicibacter longobardus]ORW07188.1 ATPase [Mycolicibacter longobardus]
MSDHAPGDATAGHDVTDHPTTQFRPYQQAAGDADRPAGASDTSSFNQQAESQETRSFGGFRTERRFAEPVDPWPAAPADTQAQQQSWNNGPATWVPQPMENPAPVYFGGAPGGGQAPYRPAEPIAPFSDLSTTSLLRQVKPPPTSGWRRLLYVASGKLINVGESPRTARFNDLVVQVNRPLQGCHRIAVLSLKGGVGKTTITATLGSTFASIRGDRVVAVDANPDRGTLSQKVPMETPATVRHLLRDADGIQRYSDVRSYTNQGPSRLEVLASESDPAVSEAFSAEDYASTLQVLERFYSLVLTDCGTGLMHSAMSAVLAKADTMIVVSSGSVDGARSASATLDWLDAHGHEELVRNSIAVINGVRPRGGKVDMQKVVDHFSRRCRAVRLIPFDPHLEEGAEIDLLRLKRDTREALVELAAVVAEAFPGDDRFNQHFV